MSGLPKGIDIDGAIQLVDAIPQQWTQPWSQLWWSQCDQAAQILPWDGNLKRLAVEDVEFSSFPWEFKVWPPSVSSNVLRSLLPAGRSLCLVIRMCDQIATATSFYTISSQVLLCCVAIIFHSRTPTHAQPSATQRHMCLGPAFSAVCRTCSSTNCPPITSRRYTSNAQGPNDFIAKHLQLGFPMTCSPSMIALLHLVANYIWRNTKLQKRNEQKSNITTLEVVVCIYEYIGHMSSTNPH